MLDMEVLHRANGWPKPAIAAALVDETQARWNDVESRYKVARAELDEIFDQIEAVEEAYDSAAPVVPVLAQRYKKGKPFGILATHDLGDPDVHQWLLTMAPEQADAIRAAVLEYEAACEANPNWPTLSKLEDNRAIAQFKLNDTRDELLNTPAPTIAAALLKIELASQAKGYYLNEPWIVSSMLTSRDVFQVGIVQARRDLVRLAGLPDSTADVVPFDAEAWLTKFEAHPGHTFDQRYGATYDDLAMFGGISDEDLTVTEPKAMEASRAHTRQVMPDYAAEYDRTRPGFWTGPFVIRQKEAIDWCYPDDPGRRAVLHELWNRREAARQAGPVGQAMVKALQSWQIDEVKRFVAKRSVTKVDLIDRVG